MGISSIISPKTIDSEFYCFGNPQSLSIIRVKIAPAGAKRPNNHLALIKVRGDSMEPELYNGDLILLDRSQSEPKDGALYVVRYSDELFVKRVQIMPDRHVSLRSTNKLYGDINIKTDENQYLIFIGRVVTSMHEW